MTEPIGPRVSRAVGVAADVAENRADVQARAAADAMQRVALLGVGEQFRAAVVEQHDVKFLRAVGFAGLARAAIHRVVTRQRLAGAGGGEHRQKQREVFKPRQNFLDAEQRDHRLRQRGGEARVAFVFRDGNHAGLGDGEIRAGDADVGREVFLPQHAARDHREFFGIVRRRCCRVRA